MFLGKLLYPVLNNKKCFCMSHSELSFYIIVPFYSIWEMDRPMEKAKSLTYIDSGHNSVRFVKVD